jgi:hypothetical protein
LQWGPNAIFDVTTGRMASIGSAAQVRKYDGMTIDEVIALLTRPK